MRFICLLLALFIQPVVAGTFDLKSDGRDGYKGVNPNGEYVDIKPDGRGGYTGATEPLIPKKKQAETPPPSNYEQPPVYKRNSKLDEKTEYRKTRFNRHNPAVRK